MKVAMKWLKWRGTVNQICGKYDEEDKQIILKALDVTVFKCKLVWNFNASVQLSPLDTKPC